jgi:hypothetical protein
MTAFRPRLLHVQGQRRRTHRSCQSAPAASACQIDAFVSSCRLKNVMSSRLRVSSYAARIWPVFCCLRSRASRIERKHERESHIQHHCLATIYCGCVSLRSRPGHSAGQEAKYCLHPHGQLGLRRTGRLRWRHPSRCAHAAYRQARKRRHAGSTSMSSLSARRVGRRS